MRVLVALSLLLLAYTGCGIAPQPSCDETVAAFEISLPTVEDRAAFLTTVRNVAKLEGGHLDAATDEDLRATVNAMPAAKMSVHAAVWRGSEDKENWAVIMDQADHLGDVWIMFARGRDESEASRFRERTIRGISVRWPDMLSLPILDRRNIPCGATSSERRMATY
jgi:hypothetical protein